MDKPRVNYIPQTTPEEVKAYIKTVNEWYDSLPWWKKLLHSWFGWFEMPWIITVRRVSKKNLKPRKVKP